MGAVALRVRYVIPDIYEHYGHMDKKNFRMLGVRVVGDFFRGVGSEFPPLTHTLKVLPSPPLWKFGLKEEILA